MMRSVSNLKEELFIWEDKVEDRRCIFWTTDEWTENERGWR